MSDPIRLRLLSLIASHEGGEACVCILVMAAMLEERDVDGDFGRKTEQAVKQFQRRQVLQADGKVGARTWAALRGRWE